MFLIKSSHNTLKEATYSQVYRLQLQRQNASSLSSPSTRTCT